MKHLSLFYLFLIFSTITFAQQGDGGNPRYVFQKTIASQQVDHVVFNTPDIQALRSEDSIVDATKSGPWRFGYNNITNLNFTNSGTWVDLPNGGKLWLLKLTCQNALTVNLTFKDLQIPSGNELYVYNPDKSFILGKFTDKHVYQGVLGTELVPGSEVIVEYYVAPQNINIPRSLTVEKVTHGYRTAKEFQEKAFGSSGSCNMNVACPDGAPWQDQIRSVVMLVSGGNGFCTGALINNTLNDGTPYVLTANHCYSDPTNWVFRFNWQSSTCTNPPSSPSFTSLSGAVLRARRTPSDMCLVEITGGLVGGTIPSSYNAYFSGWNNADVAPPTAVCIHHPSGDIKKISFDDAPLTEGNGMGSSEPNSQWVVEWDRNTTTEPGSSGSPLFDNNKRIIGQLWGGGASCSNLSAPDYYGKLSYSWNPSGSTPANHLVTWLDPNSSGVTVLDGYDPNAPLASDDIGIVAISMPSGDLCGDSFDPIVTLKNFGTNTITSATIIYDIDGGTPMTYNWTGSLASTNTIDITLPTLTTTGGSHVFNAASSMPNGNTDSNSSNDATLSNYTTFPNTVTTTIEINTDCYGYETYWEIVDASSNVLFFGGNTGTTIPPGGGQTATPGDAGAYGNETTITEQVCLQEGTCYDFVIYDDYGDGMSYPLGCSTIGSYYIYDANGNILDSIQNPAFGNSETNNFCIPSSCNVTLSTTTTPTTCQGGSDGTLTVNFITGNSIGATYDIGNGPITNNTFTGLSAGVYTVTVVDGDACTSTISDTITEPSQITITVDNVTDETSPNSGSIDVTISGGVPSYTIAWTGPNGFTSAQEDINNLSAGDYTITVTDSNGCTSSQTITVNLNTSGLEEMDNDEFLVYPNPTAGILTIKTSENKDFEIEVFDMSGRVLVSENNKGKDEIKISLLGYAKGVYQLKIRTESNLSIRKIILE